MQNATLYEDVVSKLVKYSGLSRAYVERCHLRIDPFRYAKELLREVCVTLEVTMIYSFCGSHSAAALVLTVDVCFVWPKDGKTIGRFDIRCKGVDRDGGGEHNEYDASFTNIHGLCCAASAEFGADRCCAISTGLYSACFHHYVRTTLAVEKDIKYQVHNALRWSRAYGRDLPLPT